MDQAMVIRSEEFIFKVKPNKEILPGGLFMEPTHAAGGTFLI